MADRSAEELLVHAGWLRALAFRLVRDDDDADDLVQDTWIASTRHTPEHAESAKSWLAKVIFNRLRMRARSEGRRTTREQATLLIGNDEVPTQDLLVARAEMPRKLVELVLGLEEPYRGECAVNRAPATLRVRTYSGPALGKFRDPRLRTANRPILQTEKRYVVMSLAIGVSRRKWRVNVRDHRSASQKLNRKLLISMR